MVEIKKKNSLSVTIGLQMVLMPEYSDQVLPLANLEKNQPDYLIMKHCSDNEDRDNLVLIIQAIKISIIF